MNKNVKELKNEIILEFENHLSNIQTRTESGATRYVNAIILLIRKYDKPTHENTFIRHFVRILQEPKIPFLKVEHAHKLFERSLHHPDIFNELLFIARHSGRNVLPEIIWIRLIQRSGVSHSTKHEQKLRLILLLWLVKHLSSSPQEWEQKTALIDCILSFDFEKNPSVISFRADLTKKTDGPMSILIHRLKKMWNEGFSGFELAVFFRSYYKILSNQESHSPAFNAMLHDFDQVLPNDYLLQLKPDDVLSIFELYKVRPALVQNLTAEESKVVSKKSVIKELFSKFTVPEILVNRYITNQLYAKEREWFFFLLAGHNLTNSPNLPFTLTKRMAHTFQCMKDEKVFSYACDYLIMSAFLTLTGDREYAIAVTRIVRHFDDIDYWLQTLSSLHQKGLRSYDAREVIDYLMQRVFRDRQPIDLKHKKLHNLLQDVRHWHNELWVQREFRRAKNEKLIDSGIEDSEMEHDEVVYKIIQLKESKELFKEGLYLHHCVYSYRYQCTKGTCFIFSLRKVSNAKKDKSNEIPLITLEVVNKTIVQAKGDYNRLPNSTEREIIKLWAKEQDLKYSA